MDKIRGAVRSFMNGLAVRLDRVAGGKVTPDMVTIFGLVMHVPIAVLIATQHFIVAAIFLVVFGLFDALDGALARVKDMSGPRGMILDSTTDRMKEILIYTGAAYGIIACTGRPYLAVWAVAACGCSLLTSYINAWGDAVMAKFHINQHATNKSFRGGLFPFEIRMTVLVIGLLTNHLALAVIVITFGAAYTAIERLFRVFSKLRGENV